MAAWCLSEATSRSGIPGRPARRSQPAVLTFANRQYRGLSGLLGPEVDNEGVFRETVERHLSTTVLQGATLRLFAYGHTGSGKTHSCFGYPGRATGLHHLAIESICNQLLSTEGADSLQLEVRLADLYRGGVRDLIGGGDRCSLRSDGRGGARVRGQTTKDVDSGEVHVAGLSAVRCSLPGGGAEVAAALAPGLARRTVGHSTHHTQSSRSHAILEVEIVTRAVSSAREAVRTAQAAVVPPGKRCDDLAIRTAGQLQAEFSAAVAPGVAEELGVAVTDREVMMTVLDRFQRTHPYVLDVPSLCAPGVLQRLVESGHFSPDTLGRIREIADLRAEVKRREAVVAEAEAALADAAAAAPRCVGGTLVVADLAGNEFAADAMGSKAPSASRRGRGRGREEGAEEDTEAAERRAINTSLFALKEAVRALASGRASDHVFRGSTLTRMLQPHLASRSGGVTVMLATASPTAADAEAGKTYNSLAYASLLASAGDKASGRRAGGRPRKTGCRL